MAVDFENSLGVDFSCVDDIDPSLTLVDGRLGLAQSIARRISTPRGMLFYDSDYGSDIRGRISRPTDDKITSRLVEAEAIKDERIEDVAADVTFAEATETLSIEVTLEDADGPFTLTSEISPTGTITVELMNESL